MEDIIKVCALGGLDENGRDCYVVEINKDIFVLDAGLALPDKTIPGVDYLLANAQYIINNKDSLIERDLYYNYFYNSIYYTVKNIKISNITNYVPIAIKLIQGKVPQVYGGSLLS